MLEYIKDLCQIPGISGDEAAVREYLIDKIKDKAKYEVDPLGNLFVFKQGKERAKNKVMLAAHMDEIGLIITAITQEGFLKFANVGGIDSGVLLGRSVEIGDKRIPGVIGLVPLHLVKDDAANKLPDEDELYIDIGAKDNEEALRYVALGDPAVLAGAPVHVGESCLKARALDDRAGCAIMLKLIESDLPYDLTFVFTVQEEVGLRGARAAAHAVKPDFAIVIEATTAADIAGVEAEKQVCALGKGAVVSFMDRTTVYNRELFKKAFEIAQANNILAQVKAAVAGGNDAGAIHSSAGGVKTISISLPCRYLHSASCMISINDLEESFKLVTKLAESLAND